MNEGGSIVYTATVGNAVTGTPLVIHLSNGTDITIPVGATSAVSAAVAVRADDAYNPGYISNSYCWYYRHIRR